MKNLIKSMKMKFNRKASAKTLTAFLLAAVTFFTLSSGHGVKAASYKCPGCRAAVNRKLTKKGNNPPLVTTSVTKNKLKRQYVYKLVNTQRNGNKTPAKLYAAKNKSTSVTWSVSGDVGRTVTWGTLKLGANYTQTNSKSTGGGTSCTVPAYKTVGFYVGHPVDIYSVNVVKKTTNRCAWCGRTLSTNTQKYCAKATVPVKDKTMSWRYEIKNSSSFPSTIVSDR